MSPTKEEAEEAYRELTSLVTELHGIWWEVEHHLGALLAAISNMRMKAAWTILVTVTANKVRRDIVKNVADIMLDNKKDICKIEKVLARMATAAATRSQLAHASYSLVHDRKYRLRVMSVGAQEDPSLFCYQLFSKSDLLNIKRQFEDLGRDVSDLSFEMKKARRRMRLEVWKV